MAKNHRIILIILSIAIVITVAFIDIVTVTPVDASVWTNINNFFNDLKFWQKTDEINFPEIAETQFGFLQDEKIDLYESRVEYEETIISAVDRATPSVVSIVVSKDVPILERQPVIDPFFGDMFRFYVPYDTGRTRNVRVGGGTGFFVSSDGFILTNKHVVADRKADYTVFTGDGVRYDARVVGVDDEEDLALLKIKGEGFPVLTLGNSDLVRLGQTAIAIGNALGEYEDTVSIGAVSGISRTIRARDSFGNVKTIEDALQTDAAINLGNSGGPLVNLRGEVIGINTAIADNAENIGFAIPVNRARKVKESLMSAFLQSPARTY